MFIKNINDLSNLKINMDTFKSDYMANGGNANCYLKGGNGNTETNLTVTDFMNTYLPLLKGGYRNSKKGEKQKQMKGKQMKGKKGGDGTTIEESGAAGNFFNRISAANMNNTSYNSYPDLTFNDYKFPDSTISAYR